MQDGKSTRTLELNISEEATTLYQCKDAVLSTDDDAGGVILFCDTTAEGDIKVIPLGDGYISKYNLLSKVSFIF